MGPTRPPIAFLNRGSQQAKGLIEWLPIDQYGLRRMRSGLGVTNVGATPRTVDPRLGYTITTNGTSQALQTALNVSAYTKLVLSFWLYWDNFDGAFDMALELTADGLANTGGFTVSPAWPGTDYVIGWRSTDQNTHGFPRPSAQAWHHHMISLDLTVAGGSRGVYLWIDSVAQTPNTAFSTTAGSGTFANSNLNIMSRDAASLFGPGRMADLRIYDGTIVPATQGTATTLYDPRTRWDLYWTPSPTRYLFVGAAAASLAFPFLPSSRRAMSGIYVR